MADDSQATSRLQDLLATCYEEIAAGREPDLDRICREAPDLRPHLQHLLAVERAHAEAAQQAWAPAPPTAALVGKQLGDFRLVEALGSGGMGHVYVAIQESLGREVAVKVIAEQGRLDPTSLLRFRREAEITAALDHPNIVPVYATGDSDGLVYLAMKLLHGKSAAELAPLPAKEVARIGAAVAEALDAAHRLGVVHRDVKPANIVVEDQTPYVLDFGLALAEWSETITHPGAAPGTLPYMAPELLRGNGRESDPRVDVYGLGATLYELVSGRPPFDAGTPASTVRRILQEEPLPLRAVDRDLAVIIARAMDKDPHRRFPTARDMADDLQRYREGRPITSRPSGLWRRTWKLVRRRPAVAVGLALSSLAAMVVAAQLVARTRERGRAWRQGEALVRSAVEERRFGTAEARLAQLAGIFADTPELVALKREVKAVAALESVIVQIGPGGGRSNALETMERLARLPAVAGTPSLFFVWAYAAAASGRPELAREQLDRLGPGSFPRACACLRAVLDGGDLDAVRTATPVRAEVSPRERADDHFFTSRVLRLAGRSSTAAMFELLAAEDLDLSNPRVRFDRADLLSEQGDYRLAYEICRGIEDSRPFDGGILQALLANHAMNIAYGAMPGVSDADRAAQAERWLQRSERHLADGRGALGGRPPSRQLEMAELRMHVYRGRSFEFWSRWHALEATAAHDPGFLRLGLLAASEMSDLDEMRRILTLLDRVDTLPQSRCLNRIDLLKAEFRAWRGSATRDPETIRPTMAAIDSLLADVRRDAPDLEQTVLSMLAHGWMELGEFDKALDAADRASVVGNDHATLGIYAGIVAMLARHRFLGEPTPISSPPLEELLPVAWDRHRRAARLTAARPEYRPRDELAAFWLALARDDLQPALTAAAWLGANPDARQPAQAVYTFTNANGVPSYTYVLPADTSAAQRARGRRLLLDSLTWHERRAAADAAHGHDLQRIARAWLAAPELAPVRDDDALAALEPSENDAWRELWSRVRAAAEG